MPDLGFHDTNCHGQAMLELAVTRGPGRVALSATTTGLRRCPATPAQAPADVRVGSVATGHDGGARPPGGAEPRPPCAHPDTAAVTGPPRSRAQRSSSARPSASCPTLVGRPAALGLSAESPVPRRPGLGQAAGRSPPLLGRLTDARNQR